MPRFQVTGWDISILLVYVLGTRILFGWYIARKHQDTSEGYFLGGRAMRWPIIGLSFYVANMSGGSFVGLPGSGYHDGVAVFHYEWLPALILILFVLFVLPLYLRAKIFTAPEYLARRFGHRPRLTFSAFLLLTSILIDAPASLYSGAMVMKALFPTIPVWVTIGVAAAVAGVYIFFGGLGAVVINDALQATMILVGGATISLLCFMKLPSWQAVREASGEYTLHLMRPATDDVLPWPGVWTGVLIIGIYYWCTNQFVVQRALAAKSLDHGRWGSLFAGFLKLPNLFILILPGVMARALYPDLKNPDLVFPTLVFDLLPVGVRGLLLAALAAAIFSSLEAILNSASTLFTMDFVCTRHPDLSDRGLAHVGRVATLGFMVLAALWTPVVTTFPTLWQYLQSFMSYVTPPVAAVFLVGIFWRKASEPAALLTLMVGVPLGVAGFIANELYGLMPIQYLYACGILFAANCLLMMSVSLLCPPAPGSAGPRQVWTRDSYRRESQHLSRMPWYANYRVLSLLLCVLASGLVIWWW